MDRKGIIAVTLAAIALFAWVFFNQREMDKVAAVRRAAAAEEQLRKAAEQPQNIEAPAPPSAASVPAPADPGVAEQLETLTSPAVELTFSNLGGGIARALLLRHEAERGRKMVINEFGPTPIGAISEVAGEAARGLYTATLDPAGTAITFQSIDARQLEITKKFTLPQTGDGADEYGTRLEVAFTNRSTQPIALPGYFVETGAAAPVHQRDLPTYTGMKVANGKFIDVNWFTGGGFLGIGSAPRPIYTETRADLAWMGVTNQYFTTLVSPQVTSKDAAAQVKQARGFRMGAAV